MTQCSSPGTAWPMHEFSLAQGLVNQLLALAGQHHSRKICTVRVEIGSLAGIVADSFAFGSKCCPGRTTF